MILFIEILDRYVYFVNNIIFVLFLLNILLIRLVLEDYIVNLIAMCSMLYKVTSSMLLLSF